MPETQTLYRAPLFHTPRSPFDHPDALESWDDGGVLVQGGAIRAVGNYGELSRTWPQARTDDLRGGVLLPGFVDTHVHFPQVRVLGGLGLPLLEWLDRIALPEEARMADEAYAAAVAGEFVGGLLGAGTTTALVFGSHFAAATDRLFQESARRGLRVVAGQVLGDRLLRADLHTTPQQALAEGAALIRRWHGVGRALYAVTPRFSLSCSSGLLDACGELLRSQPGVRFTSHINENGREIETVRGLFPEHPDYLATYEAAGLIGRGSVLAHNVHPQERELRALAAHGCAAAHCPCSNAALGSGLFPLRRHLAAGVTVALGSDVGGGTGFSLLKEGLQAYFMQQLLGDQGWPLSPAHLLYLGTLAGARALGLEDQTGSFTVGRQFDAVLLRPLPSSTLETVLAHAESPERVLAALFTLGSSHDTARVWVGGDEVYRRLKEGAGSGDHTEWS